MDERGIGLTVVYFDHHIQLSFIYGVVMVMVVVGTGRSMIPLQDASLIPMTTLLAIDRTSMCSVRVVVPVMGSVAGRRRRRMSRWRRGRFHPSHSVFMTPWWTKATVEKK